MIRIVFALAIVAATGALVAAIPAGGVAIVLVGATIAVFVAATGASERIERDTRIDRGAQPASNVVFAEAIAAPVLLVTDSRVVTANAAARLMLGDHIVGEDVRLAIRHPAAAERLSAGAPDGVTELAGLAGRDQRIAMHVATLAPGQRLIHLVDQTGHHAAERARTDFVANSSHELRTPLAAIIGFIETLDDDATAADPGVRRRFLSVMMKEAKRMQRLIDDLISLSRIEAEKHSLPETPIDLRALVREIAGEVSVAPSLALPEEPILVQGDRTQLSQLLHNLVGNAIKYGHENEAPGISITRDEKNVRLAVSDTGDGIAPEHLPRLTERFYRVDPSRSRAMGGTGLGLAIVKHIVERHRGRLDITSTVGVGTTATVILPTAAHPAVTEPSPN